MTALRRFARDLADELSDRAVPIAFFAGLALSPLPFALGQRLHELATLGVTP